MRLAAAIIAHNSARHLGACLESCQRFGQDFEAGILVVDNASTDHSLEVARSFPCIHLLANSENRGFAGAVNQAFDSLPDADAVLILNPDIVIQTPPTRLADELAADLRLGAVSGLLLDDAGQPQNGFAVRRYPTPAVLIFETLGLNRMWSSNPVNRRYRALDLDPLAAADGLQPAGACVLVRRRAWRQLGGFDERFHPVWFEDVDFFRRLEDSGWLTRYLPEFRARHSGAHSVAGLSWARRQLYWYSSLLRYADLHFPTPSRAFVCVAVCVGVLPRMVTGMFHLRSTQPVRLFGNIIRLALTYLGTGRHSAAWTGRELQVVPEECEPTGPRNRSGA
jgi:GT2 family glycosyltransferase